MTRTISNSDNVIDSRDVIARVRELEEEREALAESANEERPDDEEDAKLDAETALAEWDEENGAELKALKALDDESPGDDWAHGSALVRDTCFVEYCRELVSDIGDMPKEIPSYIVIDWDKTADNLRQDYTEVDYDGLTYLVR